MAAREYTLSTSPSGISRLSGIYRILCVDGRFYIGSAICLRARFGSHRNHLRRGTHDNHRLQAAWCEFGEAAFTFDVVEFVDDPSNLVAIEQAHLDALKPYDPKVGFNICATANATTGFRHSPETKAKLAAMSRGKKHTAASREKMSIAQRSLPTGVAARKSAAVAAAARARVRTPEERSHMGEKSRRRWADPAWRAKMLTALAKSRQDPVARANHHAGLMGHSVSDTARANMSAAQKRRFADPAERARMQGLFRSSREAKQGQIARATPVEDAPAIAVSGDVQR